MSDQQGTQTRGRNIIWPRHEVLILHEIELSRAQPDPRVMSWAYPGIQHLRSAFPFPGHRTRDCVVVKVPAS